MEVFLVPLSCLLPHEHVRSYRAREIKRNIEESAVFKRPIVVDRETGTILDGHHRFTAAKIVGLTRIPAFLVKYTSAEIEVVGWKDPVTKMDVLRAALSGRLMPPKTSRHLLPFEQERVDLPLEEVRE
ncbi:MAG: transcriptional regulator [Thermoproteota archaeon]|jgi:uncharacterized protein (DUF1015 family)|uniref:Transcriptional regulator n=1 Tax=Candidatus Methanodesulfokora washburnensis TaxID=2478471 RepID=A0A3R9Q1W0_9CREN|nr:ParB N-terminal domain-containing protein [Candidatus Methanodesulfokores washburnensis]RSN79050.1 transcriptional regulator [Candidatus Methanodesulfokores washburnensis]TDA42249.1 MAG: transcriptional regulator [Candidatus Korarchaeota archaeon]